MSKVDMERLQRPLNIWGLIGYWVIVTLGLGIARFFWRLKVEGTERIPTVGAFVLAPVHRSFVDFLLMAIVVPRRMRFMGKSSLWDSPRWFQRFIEMLGAFPVDRDAADRDALKLAEGLIRSGQPVVMFPEGKRKEGAVVEDLFDGPAFVACRQRVPIVPVAIGGSEGALPLGSKMIRFARVRVVIGEPIHPDVPAEGRVSRKCVTGVTEVVQQDLQKLYDGVR